MVSAVDAGVVLFWLSIMDVVGVCGPQVAVPFDTPCRLQILDNNTFYIAWTASQSNFEAMKLKKVLYV